MHTESGFVGRVLRIHDPEKQKNVTLHTESNAFIFLFIAKIRSAIKKMESSSSEDDFLVLSLIEKRKGQHWVHPILKTREERGEFHLLVEELRKYPDRLQVYFRCWDLQLNILAIKN